MLARLGKGQDAWALALPGVEPMAMRGRTMEGWVRAGPAAWGDDAVRARLIEFRARLRPRPASEVSARSERRASRVTRLRDAAGSGRRART